MGLKYSLTINTKEDLKKWKQALISDPASDVTDCASTVASIIDVLQAYGMMTPT